MLIKEMPAPKIVRTVVILAFIAAGLDPCLAEPDSQARALVFTRETPTGARLTFDWDSHEKVPFSVTHNGHEVTLHFEEPVRLRWGSTLKAVRPYIEQVETRDGGNTVILTLDEPSKAHYLEFAGPHDVDNGKNGVDLVAASDAGATGIAASEDAEAEPAPHALKAAPKKVSGHAKKVREARAKVKAREHEEARRLSELAPAAGSPAPGAALPASPIVLAPPAPAVSSVTPAAPLPVTPSPAPSPPPAAEAQPQPAAPVAPVLGVPLPPAAGASPAVIVPLPFKAEEAFAVFVWQHNLWVVSANPAPLLADSLTRAGAPYLKDAKTIPASHGAVLSIPLKDDISASVEKSSQEHQQLVLKPGAATLSHTIAPMLASSASGKASVTLAAPKAGAPITFQNPMTGEAMSVIPTSETAAGVAAPQRFVEFSLLPSSQGITVQSLSDRISVRLDNGTVTIATDDGLALSQQARQQMQDAQSEASLSKLPSVLYPYARWRLEDETAFVPAQIKLTDDIVFGPPDAANKTRLKLLGLYLSEGLFPEALGMSDDILRSSLSFYQDNKVSAMRGAAYLFTYRIPEAERDFSAPELKNDHESQMLYNLCEELLGKPVQEHFDFQANYDRYISHYPPPFIAKLAVIAADRSINRKDYAAANAIFETIKKDNYDEPVKKYVDYMRAKIFSETHEEAEAAKIWSDQAKDLDDPLIRARAEFSLINMLLKSDKITHEDAEKRLEQLRIVWRGDNLEVTILTLLGNLYTQDKQYARALHTMRDIVLYYPDLPQAVTTARQMEEIFVTLYSKGGADIMPPLEALSLFYEFRDLVPLGGDGDQMIRNLADRLENLDLLDRAAVLLDHQIRNRLTGEERSRVAAELARIYLLNHQPEQALDILKTTGYGDLPPPLQLQRLRLTARALAQQGQPGKAIGVIAPDTSQEGTLLRLSIYWDNKDWQNVIAIAEDLLGNRADPSAPLNTPESEVLLKLATAYVYEHDTGQLQYLRDYFTPLMKKNPNRENFRFITSESGTVDYDNLANLTQDIGEVKSYIDKSQDRPGKNGFSKAAN